MFAGTVNGLCSGSGKMVTDLDDLACFNEYIRIFQFAFFFVGPDRGIFDQQVLLAGQAIPSIPIEGVYDLTDTGYLFPGGIRKGGGSFGKNSGPNHKVTRTVGTIPLQYISLSYHSPIITCTYDY